MTGTSSPVQQLTAELQALREARALRLRRINGHQEGLRREAELFQQESERAAELLALLESSLQAIVQTATIGTTE